MEVLFNILYFIALIMVVLLEIIGLFTVIRWFTIEVVDDIETYKDLKAKLKFIDDEEYKQ